MNKSIYLALMLIFSSQYIFSSDTLHVESKSTINTTPKFFGNIFTGFYYRFNEEYKPKAGFELSTGLVGYSNQLSDDVSAIIIFDVTRTTNNIIVTDSNGTTQNVEYFEGSKYTAFLKMAEIKWSVSENVDLRVGQLLSTQYLTFLDKFWGYRYVYVTFQEAYRFGNPADFGLQLDFKDKNFVNSISVLNGEGPFRNQDIEGKFLISNNLQITPVKGFTIKLYVDYAKQPIDSIGKPKTSFSGFLGYKCDQFRIGGEYNYVNNYSFQDGLNFSGSSIYGSYKIQDNVELFGRWDYITESLNIVEGHYIIFGYQYEPVTNFFTSINIRHLMPGGDTQLYFNFGIKF